MEDEHPEREGEPLHELEKHMPDAPVAPAHGIAAIALSMAMKFHDINTVQDGLLYQQYKLEGKNLRGLELGMVFDTAIKIEKHLLASSQRIAAIVIEAITTDEPEEANQEEHTNVSESQA